MKKTVILLISILFMAGCGSVQNSNLTKEERALQKAQKEAEEKLVYETAIQALTNQAFVIEADKLISSSGRTVFVSSDRNFIMVNQDNGTVQTSSNSPNMGSNGVGGITLDGLISKVEIKTSKKGNISYSFSIQGAAISAQIEISIPYGSDYAMVNISPNFSSNRITMNGRMVPLEQSNVYKGRSI